MGNATGIPTIRYTNRCCALEQLQTVRPMLTDQNAVHPPRLEISPRKRAKTLRCVGPIQPQWLGKLQLSCPQEGRQLHQIHTIIPIIIPWVTTDPTYTPIAGRGLHHLTYTRRVTGTARQRRTDPPLQTTLRSISGHCYSSLQGRGVIISRDPSSPFVPAHELPIQSGVL